jgi:hypothetical protein
MCEIFKTETSSVLRLLLVLIYSITERNTQPNVTHNKHSTLTATQERITPSSCYFPVLLYSSRFLTMDLTGKENIDGIDYNREADGGPAAERPKVVSSAHNVSTFRNWAADKESPGPVYTIRCNFGRPFEPLPSWIKTSKKDVLIGMLRSRGLDTTGTKPVLLERIQYDTPSVTIKIDGRECVQRLINAYLTYFGWDNSHLFEVKMPRKGDSMLGATKLREETRCESYYQQSFEMYGIDPEDWPYHEQRWVRELLQNGEYTMEELRQACSDDNALGHFRKLSGSASDPMSDAWDYVMNEPLIGQASAPLEDLDLEPGDVMLVRYDFGDDVRFTLTVEKVETSAVLTEEILQEDPTRAKLLYKFAIPPTQYGDF